MSFKLPYAAELDTLAAMLNGFLANSWMGLLDNPISITTGTTLTDCIDNECTFSGYARYHLTSWTAPVIDTNGAAATVVTGFFTGSGGGGTGNVWGYFLTDSGSTFFYGAEVLASAITAPTGVQIAMTFTFTVKSAF